MFAQVYECFKKLRAKSTCYTINGTTETERCSSRPRATLFTSLSVNKSLLGNTGFRKPCFTNST